MSEERQVFVDMTIHSLESDIADLERSQSPEEITALKREEPRILASIERLWNLAKNLQRREAA